MAGAENFKVVMRHPIPESPGGARYAGNLSWSLADSAEIKVFWETGAAALRKKGYFISPFPEGDGATFDRSGKRRAYEPERAIKDFTKAFPRFSITAAAMPEALGAIADLNEDMTVQCTALVPVEHMLLHRRITLPGFRMYPPVTSWRGIELHPWGDELCDVPDDVRREGWEEDERIGPEFLARLLKYPLMEIVLELPVSLIQRAGLGFGDENALILRVLETADSCLTLLRMKLCSYKRLAYLPGRAGRLADGTCAFYLIPSHPALNAQFYDAVAEELTVSNNWLGLEVDPFRPTKLDQTLSKILSGKDLSTNSGEIRHALRTLGEAYYLVSKEARFLQLIYALDAIAGLDRNTTGLDHRLHVAALTCRWDESNVKESETRFREGLATFERLYSRIRNRLVHGGATFASLGFDATKSADEAARLLVLCVMRLLEGKLDHAEAIRKYVARILALPFVAELRRSRRATVPA